jgi:signal transduction histidine kinase
MPENDLADVGRPGKVLPLLDVAQHAVFVLLVLIGAVRAGSGSDALWWVLAGSLVLLAWYATGLILAGRVHARPAPLVWLAGLTLIWALLVAGSPDFAWVAFALFFVYLRLLPPRVAMPGVAVLTAGVIAALLLHGGGNTTAQVVGPLIGAVVATVTALAYRSLLGESDTRRELIEQLVLAQDDLLASHDELARVQREAGVLQERERLAREIHDTLAQGLSSIIMLLRAARSDLADGPQAAVERMSQAERTAAENLEDARRFVGALTPTPLAGTPLSEALQRLTARLSEESRMEGRYRCEGTPYPLPTTHEVALLRVAQGALANVRKHAHARAVTVTLSYMPDAVTLDVVDDGRGFDAQRIESAPLGGSGFGLRSMRGRLADLAGTLVIESEPGAGTAVAATIPAPGA